MRRRTFYLYLVSILSCDAAIGKRTLNIPLTLDALGRYSVKVNMSSSAPQSFDFVLSLGTGYTAVQGTACDSCSGGPAFNSAASSSAHVFRPGEQNVSIPGASGTGQIIKEDCALAQSNGSSWKYPNQTIILLNQSSSLISASSSGVFGLGTNRRVGADFFDTVFGGFFTRNPNQTKFSYGMALNAPFEREKDGGVLHWLDPDPSFFQGNASFRNVVLNSNLTSDWVVAMDGWTFSSGGKRVATAGQNLQTAVDPYYSNIYVPKDEAQLIYGTISGASPQSGNTLSQPFTIPCNTKMSFATVFGDQTFILDESTLVINNNGTCVGAIEAWSDPGTSEYLLGATFISSVYLIFSVSTNSPDSIGFARRFLQSQSSLSGGAIAGIIVGSLAVLGVIAVGIFFFIRSRRRRDTEGVDRPLKEGEIQPYPITPASRDGFLLDSSTPMAVESNTGHTYSNVDGGYTAIPQSPTSTARDSWADSQQQVTMSVQRNQKNLGNTVTPMIAVGGAEELPPPTFTEAIRNSQILPPTHGGKR